MRTVSPTRSSETFYYHVKLLTLHSSEPYTDPFNFKINLQKGIQKLDSTRRPHTFEGSELNLEDVVTFQMPFYNPSKKKIDFNLLLIELAQEEIEVCTAVLPVGEHTQDFIKDNSQRIFQGTTNFDDGNFTIDYILYVDRVKTSLLALVAGVSQNQGQTIPLKSARGSKQEDTKSSKLSELSSPTSPQPKIELKSETRSQQKNAPTRVVPTRDTRPPVQKVPEPEPQSPNVEVQVEEPVPAFNTKTSSQKADLPSRNSKKEVAKQPKEQKVEIPAPTVIPPPPDRNLEKGKSTMLSSKESTGKRHLKAPGSSTVASEDTSKSRKEDEKQKQTAKGESSNSKMGLIIAAVVIAALIFGFLFTRGGGKAPKGKGRKGRN